MKYLHLTKGNLALIDDEDFEFVSQFKWRTNDSTGKIYGVREIWNKGDRYTEHLHRIILERKIGRKLKRKEVTDHIDGNGLNNKRENLRAVSQSTNMLNARKRKDNTSGYRGIYWNKAKNGFDVYLNKNGKRYRFGRYKKLEDAIKARQEAEKKYYDFYTIQGQIQRTTSRL